MESEATADPREEPLEPTREEIDAWAAREHKRREAWASGPTDAEKQAWARGYRRRALLGLAESRLPPSSEDVEQWAMRERKRREAWAAGPTEEEKAEWAERYRFRAFAGLSESALAPTREEVEVWTEREGQRRREWLAGPDEEEKRRWALRESGGFFGDWMRPPVVESGLYNLAGRFLREAELAAKGSLYALSRAPWALWSYFLRAGERFEEELSQQPPRRSRVRL
jgi:hypothetical protein